MTNRIRPLSAAERLVPAAPEIAPDTTAAPRSVTPERPSARATPALREWFRRDGLHGEPMPGAAGFAAAHFSFLRNELPGFIEDGPRLEPRHAHAEHESWRARIEELRSYAAEDGEPFNEASERDLWVFLRSNPSVRKNALVLAPNGNLRAVWRRDAGAHLGAQFLGDGMLLYVIFKRRSDTDRISRVSGRDDFEGFKRQAEAFDLDSLLYE